MNKSKREFIKLSAVAAASMALAGYNSKSAAAASAITGRTAAVSLEECQSLNPKDMAERSPMVRDSWNYLEGQIAEIKDRKIRDLTAGIYADSTPRLGRYDAKQRKAVWDELKAAGYTERSQQDFLPPVPSGMKNLYPGIAAPGSGYGSHHAYPGGLVTHVATNVRITSNIVDTYNTVYGYNVDKDIAMAAQLLHDLHKPYVFQWGADAASRTEQTLAGTGEHHVLSLAELIVRKAPADLVVAQACAHTHPGTSSDEAQVVKWLKAASIIAGVNAVNYGLLDKSGQTLPLPRKQEGFICHLGDHDFVLSVPAVQWTLPVLKEMAASDYRLSGRDLEGKPFNSLRNMVYSQLSAMRLEQALTQGKNEFQALVHSVVKPV